MEQESPSDYYQGTHYNSVPDPYLPEPVHTAAVHSSSSGSSRPTSCIGGSNMVTSNSGSKMVTSRSGGSNMVTSRSGGSNMVTSRSGGSNMVTSHIGGSNMVTSHIGGSNRPASCPMPAMHYPEDYPEDYWDMEKCKLERKRERNRLAANKCRMKKVERIVELDQEVTGLQEEQRRLGQQRDQLRHQMATLRARLEDHLAGGQCRHTSAPGRTTDSTC